MNDKHNLEHCLLHAYVYICVCNSTPRIRSLRLQQNVHRIWALQLELPTGVPDPKVTFRHAHGPKINNPPLTKVS